MDLGTQEEQITHGPDFQRAALRLMLQDDVFCDKAIGFVKDDFFSGHLKWIHKKIKEYYEDFHRAPDKMFFDVEARKFKDSEKFLEEVESVYSVVPDAAYVRRELTTFVRANIFIDSYKRATHLYNGVSKEQAFEYIRDKMEELYRADFMAERVTRFGDSEAIMARGRIQQENSIPTGLFAIDQALFGGLMPQTWTTFIGSTNAGKSLFCTNLAYHAAQAGKKVFVTIHEDEEIPTKLRYLSCFSGVAYNRLIMPQEMLTPEEREAIQLADEYLTEFVVLRFMYGKDSYLEAVIDAVRQAKRDLNFDLFLCDYGQCLKTTAFRTMDNKHDVQEYIYEQLKQICLELNIAGAGGAQVNREGNKVNKAGADFLRGTDIGSSFGIVKKSSNVISLNRSNSDMSLNRMVFLLDKVRHGRCPVAVESTTRFDVCRTHEGAVSQREISVEDGPTRVDT